MSLMRRFESDGQSSDSYFLYGISASTKLGDKLSAYATYSKADITTSYDIGLNS
jgi:hypothetical protein